MFGSHNARPGLHVLGGIFSAAFVKPYVFTKFGLIEVELFHLPAADGERRYYVKKFMRGYTYPKRHGFFFRLFIQRIKRRIGMFPRTRNIKLWLLAIKVKYESVFVYW